MDEYIKKQDAFDAITYLAGKASTRSAYEAVWKSARTLKKIPAADVVQVVRCKDCEYAVEISSSSSLRHCMFSHMAICPDDFCSCGERKDEGAEVG